MVGLARTIYNPRPGESSISLPDPAELCDPALFATFKDLEGHLFDAFIPAAYRDYRTLGSRRWTAARAERWLVYLARHLTDLGGTTDLAWWELWHATPRQLSGIVTGLISGLAIGIAAWLGPGSGIWNWRGPHHKPHRGIPPSGPRLGSSAVLSAGSRAERQEEFSADSLAEPLAGAPPQPGSLAAWLWELAQGQSPDWSAGS